MRSEPPRRVYRTWTIDSRRWRHYRPRSDDIVIATYPKCGTTWMQRILSLLIFRSPEPQPIWDISPWIERRFPEPVGALVERLEAQTHRRFLKTHLPVDGLPIHEAVRYIHVARDGRDACLSLHNQTIGWSPGALAALDREGLADETIKRTFPRVPEKPAHFFRKWISEGLDPEQPDGWPILSYFASEHGWWQRRADPAVLFVHYADLKADLAGEMRRVARFLDIEVAEDMWPALVEAAGFPAMRRDGDLLLPGVGTMFVGGSRRFLAQGTNERWRGILSGKDLATYEGKLRTELAPSCARWLTYGRLGAGDPARTPD